MTSTADTRPLGKSIFLHENIWTQTNTLSMPVLLALLSFRAIWGLRDHLVQPPHFSVQVTKAQRGCDLHKHVWFCHYYCEVKLEVLVAPVVSNCL